MLWNDEKARTALRPHELAEVARHRRLVVRDQDAVIAGGGCKDVQVLQAGQTGSVAVLKSIAGTRLTTADTMT